jgi:hypothetical protein
MKKVLRRVRAAIGMGLIWGAAWFGAGMILLLIVGLGAADVPFPLGFGMFGFFAGSIFSLLFGMAESGRRFEQMSLPRFAGWGGAAGLLLAAMFALIAAVVGESTPMESLAVIGPVFALAGAASAAGSLAIARSSGKRDMLGAGADAGHVGRTRIEAKELGEGRD